MIERIQNLPESQRNVILWVSVGIIAAFLLLWLADRTQRTLRDFDAGQIAEEVQVEELEQQTQESTRFFAPAGTTTTSTVENNITQFKDILKEAQQRFEQQRTNGGEQEQSDGE